MAKSGLSQPSGMPATTQGNLMTRVDTSSPVFWQSFIVLEWKSALKGVVMIVVFRPREAKSLAMFMAGIVWPCSISGKKQM